jgi:hypothetical protein
LKTLSPLAELGVGKPVRALHLCCDADRYVHKASVRLTPSGIFSVALVTIKEFLSSPNSNIFGPSHSFWIFGLECIGCLVNDRAFAWLKGTLKPVLVYS